MFDFLIFKISNYYFYTHSLINVISALVFVMSLVYFLRKLNIDYITIVKLICLLIIFGILGTHILSGFISLVFDKKSILYVITNLSQERSYYGGLILNIIITFLFIKRHRLPEYQILDIVTLSQTAALSISRFACLSAGCCFGKPTNFQFGIKLNSSFVLEEFRNIYLYPTQIYEIAGVLIILLICFFVYYKIKEKGYVFILYLLLYSLLRFFIDFYRNYPEHYYIINGILTISQFLSIFIFFSGLVFYFNKDKIFCLKKCT